MAGAVREGSPMSIISPDLFAAERRFEVRALNVLNFFVLSVGTVALLNFDWWLLGICLVSIFLNGVIGQGLLKNRRKTLAQLIQGSEAETSDAPNLYSDRFLARNSANFTLLTAFTVAAMAFVLGQSWWIVAGATVFGFFIGSILVGYSRVRS
jgi:hypothetical protein